MNRTVIFLVLALFSLMVVSAGYMWYMHIDTRDFNFAPAFMIMFGTVGTVVGAVGAFVTRSHK